MFCPHCRAEYQPSYEICSDCQTPLVPELPQAAAPRPTPEEELVTVFRTSNPALIIVAESLLQDLGIEFLVRNAATLSLIPVSRFFVQLQVRAEDAGDATEALARLKPEGDGEAAG